MMLFLIEVKFASDCRRAKECEHVHEARAYASIRWACVLKPVYLSLKVCNTWCWTLKREPFQRHCAFVCSGRPSGVPPQKHNVPLIRYLVRWWLTTGVRRTLRYNTVPEHV